MVTPELFHLLAIAVAAILVSVFPTLRNATGYLILGIATAAMVYGRDLPTAVFWLGVAYATVLILERLTAARNDRRKLRWIYSCLAISTIAATFLVVRHYGWKGLRTTFFTVEWTLLVPDMWLLLRLLSFLWEYGSGRTSMPRLGEYLRWVLLPVTLGGPLFRFSQFQKQGLNTQSGFIGLRRASLLALSLVQIALGLGLDRITVYLQSSPHHKLAVILITFGSGPWAFYLAATGTFNFMEYLADSWGLKLPTSFNKPFGQPNLSDFWARWNITATDFFRDSLFYQRWGLKRPNPYLNVLVLFTVVGLWHGANAYWTLWGVFHGIGFAIFLLYRKHRKKLRGLMPLRDSPVLRFASSAFTYAFVCLLWYLPNKIVPLINHAL